MTDIALDSLRYIAAPIVVIGQDDLVSFANEAGQDLLGYDPLATHYGRVFRQPGLLDLIEKTKKTSQPGETTVRFHRNGRDDQYRVWVAIAVLGGKTGLVLSFEDLSSQEEVGRARKDFIANVSHELRTPLTAIIGYLETLRGPAKKDPDASRRFLELAETEAQRMTRLVADLLSLSSVEAEARIRPTTQVEMHQLLQMTVSGLEPLIEEKDATIDLAGVPVDTEVRGNQDQLQQVFSNLIENALRYGGRNVSVSLVRDKWWQAAPQKHHCFSVKDDGPGIAAHHLPRLTERFYRVDQHRSRKVGGTGLGLAIVKHILNRHLGRMRITSKVGRGTNVLVLLPKT